MALVTADGLVQAVSFMKHNGIGTEQRKCVRNRGLKPLKNRFL